MASRQREQGFTLIELMAVVAILSILLTLALAAYQDYLVRSKVSEGMGFAGEARSALSEYYYNVRAWPADNRAAGLPLASQYGQQFDFLERLDVSGGPRPGTIRLTFNIPGSSADGKELHLVPSTQQEIIAWTCTLPDSNAMEPNHVPPNCRNSY